MTQLDPITFSYILDGENTERFYTSDEEGVFKLTSFDLGYWGGSDYNRVIIERDAELLKVAFTPYSSISDLHGGSAKYFFLDYDQSYNIWTYADEADISLGNGGDSFIRIKDLSLGGNFSTGDGNDKITILTNQNYVESAGEINISSGDGNDVILIDTHDKNLYVDLKANIDAGDGDNTITIELKTDAIVRVGDGYNIITTNDGDDLFILSGGNDRIDAGLGTDTIQINGSYNDYNIKVYSENFVSLINKHDVSERIWVENVEFFNFSNGSRVSIENLSDSLPENFYIHNIERYSFNIASDNLIEVLLFSGNHIIGTVDIDEEVHFSDAILTFDQLFSYINQELPVLYSGEVISDIEWDNINFSAGKVYLEQVSLGFGESETQTLNFNNLDHFVDLSNIANYMHDPNDVTIKLKTYDYIFNFGGGDDYFQLSHGFATVNGGAGDDFFITGSSDDILNGDDGNDRFMSGMGNDTLDGGDGYDTAIYNDLTGHQYGFYDGIRADLSLGTVEKFGVETDTLTHIENITGTYFGDVLIGDDGNNTLMGMDGDDVLQGGFGNDYLHGGNGDDTYIYDFGDRGDVIKDTSGVDRIIAHQYNADYVQMSVINIHDIAIRFNYQYEFILENQALENTEEFIEFIEFADGVVWDLAEMTWTLSSYTDVGYWNVEGTYRDDILLGNGGNPDETLIGGAGDDILQAGLGDDTYVWNLGDGSDTITDIGGNDRILFGADVQVQDVRLWVDFDNLQIYIGDEVITINSQLDNEWPDYKIETLEFHDGTIWNLTGNLTFTGSDNDDIASKSSFANDTYFVLGGNDQIQDHSGGNDTYIGGIGNDFFSDIGGDDTYIWNIGDGSDGIHDEGGSDRILFGADVSVQDVRLGAEDWDLYFYIGAEEIRVSSHFYEGDIDSIIESAEFADGTIWDLTSNLTFTGTDGDDLHMQGTAWDDTFIGGAGQDTVSGYQGGNDTFIGGEGNDYLNGGAGNDTYIWNWGDGHDVIGDRGGNDRILFGQGVETYDVRLGVDDDNLIIFIDRDEIRVASHFNDVWTQSVETIEFADGTIWDLTGDLTFTGTDDDDQMRGTSGNDTFIGGLGVDFIRDYLGGDDTFIGGLGNDRLVGGAGNDTYMWNIGDGNDSIEDSEGVDSIVFGQGITVSDLVFAQDVVSGLTIHIGDEYLVLSGHGTNNNWNIEYAVFADGTILNLVSNTLTGTENNDTLEGGDSNDSLHGYAGDDNLQGGNGNDTLNGGAGNDRLDGGDGLDTASYENEGAGVSVSLGGGTATDGSGDTDTLISIENVLGSAYADILTGSAVSNTMRGGNAGDTINGLAGDDFLYGENGNDTIFGADGIDTIDGGAGDDELYGGAGVDTIDGGDGKDAIQGGDDGDTINGGNGSDKLYGQLGDDTIRGGAHNDEIYGGDGNDWLYGEADFDKIYGGAGDDTIDGGDYNDVLYGEGGNDTMHGGTGIDIMAGGDGDDTLNGDEGNDDLYGGLGLDILNGGDGDDYIVGEDGNDTINGGAGNDRLYGQNDDDIINGDEGHDDLYGGLGADTLNGGIGDDRLEGFDGDDTLGGGDGADKLYGQNGNDTLDGGDGNDILGGGDGDDILYGGDGIDKLYGGAGADTFGFRVGESGSDDIFDFSIGQGDTIDVSELISFNEGSDEISNFVNIWENSKHTFVEVDVSGSGSNFVQIAKILNTTGLGDETTLFGTTLIV